jgi:hypothetical protein
MPTMILSGYYTEDDLVAVLKAKGIKTSKRTLRSWRQRREGPSWTRMGKTVLYNDEGVDAHLKAQTQQPVRSRRQHHT